MKNSPVWAVLGERRVAVMSLGWHSVKQSEAVLAGPGGDFSLGLWGAEDYQKRGMTS